MRGAALIATALALGGSLAPAVAVEAVTHAGWADYNGDGFDDLAIGVPGDKVGPDDNAGSVIVVFGSTGGLDWNDPQLLTQDVLPQLMVGSFPTGLAEPGDAFGATLTSGDFDDDGFADLAVGAPGEDLEGIAFGGGLERGAVYVLWGSNGGVGPSSVNAELGTIGGGPGSRLGVAMTAIDIADAASSSTTIGDGKADLVVATEQRRLVVMVGAQTVNPRAIFGASNRFVVNLDTLVASPLQAAVTLAACQLDSDSIEELVVGLPDATANPSPTGISLAGAIAVVQRQHMDDATPFSVFYQGDFGQTSVAGDHFGASVACAQLVGSAIEEVVVGVPGKDVLFNGSPVIDAGAVMQLIGSTAVPITQATTDVPDDPEPGDLFGSALAFGRLDANSTFDLVVGVPGEHLGNTDNAGSVIIFFGNNTRRQLHQNVSGVAGVKRAGDRFGSSLAIGQFGNGKEQDLAVGVPNDNEPDAIKQAGVVNVFYGRTAGPSGASDMLFHKKQLGIHETQTNGDQFGQAVH